MCTPYSQEHLTLAHRVVGAHTDIKVLGPQEGWDTELPVQLSPFAATRQPICKSPHVPHHGFKPFSLERYTDA